MKKSNGRPSPQQEWPEPPRKPKKKHLHKHALSATILSHTKRGEILHVCQIIDRIKDVPLPYPYTERTMQTIISRLKGEGYFEKLVTSGMYRRI